MPLKQFIRIVDTDSDAGQDCSKKDNCNNPVQGYEQAGHGKQGDAVPHQLNQVIDNGGGAIGAFLLGPVEGIKVLWGLIIFQVHLH